MSDIQTFTCPNGHKIAAGDHDTVECSKCELIATWLNHKTGEVFTWTPIEEHDEACRNLQDQIDAAFDHQYFDEL